MGKLDRVKWVVGPIALVALIGCANKRVRDPDAPSSGVVPTASAKSATRGGPRDDRFDAKGNLKESGQRVDWLVLPMGFSKSPGSSESLSAWEALDMPIAKVTAYLEGHLAASAIDVRDNGVVYRQAKPTHTQLPLPPVNVTALEVAPGSKRVRLVIEDLAPPREPPKPESVLARQLAEQRKRAE